MTRQNYIAHLDHLRKGVVDLMEYDAKPAKGGAKPRGKKKGGAK